MDSIKARAESLRATITSFLMDDQFEMVVAQNAPRGVKVTLDIKDTDVIWSAALGGVRIKPKERKP